MTEDASNASGAPVAQEENLEAALSYGLIGTRLSEAGLSVKAEPTDSQGVESVSVEPIDLVKVALFLRDTCQFDLLLSCSAVDWSTRLESVYHLYSTQTHGYFALKVTANNEHSPSLVSVWPAANWHEREAYDLFGIQYDGHPNLERILMPSDWLGHPLRKNYKLNDPRLVWNER
jgi:NADH-quinone oxidoreductase subunit C